MTIGIKIAVESTRYGGLGQLVSAFKARVLADGGTFEAEQCLNSQITNLINLSLYEKASLILTPNAYKATKIYSFIPTTGVGDFTVSRASTAMRRNSFGIWESVDSNVLRLHYPVGGGCPGWLFEIQRTNIVLKSRDFTDAVWTIFGASITNTSIPSNISGVNFSRFTINNSSGQDRVSQPTVMAAGQTRTLSVYLKSDTFAGDVIIRGDAGGNTANVTFNMTTNALFNSGANVQSSRVFLEDNGVKRIEFVFTSVLNPIIDVGVFNTGVSNVSFLITQVQLELGAWASSPIITEGAIVTRTADIQATLNVSSMFTAREGTILWELDVTAPTNKGTVYLGAFINGGNYVRYRINGIAIQNEWFVGGSFINQQAGGTIIAGKNKIVFSFRENNVTSLYLNGVKIADQPLASIFNLANLQLGDFGSISPVTNPINNFLIFNQKLSDAECIALAAL